jgi:hypothetical protein
MYEQPVPKIEILEQSQQKHLFFCKFFTNNVNYEIWQNFGQFVHKFS